MIHDKTYKDELFNQVQTWIEEYKTTNDAKIQKELKKLITVALLPFVRKIAIGLARRSTDHVDDLIQAGALGLMKAIKLYDINVSQRFKTYATYLITGEMKHYLRDKAAVIRPPRDIHELSYRINNLLRDIKIDGSDVSADQIAEALCVPVEKVKEVFEVDRRKRVLSLDEIVINDDDYSIPLVEKIAERDYKDETDLNEAKIMLNDAINKLDDRLKETVSLIYYDDMTQREVSEKLNISQMQVSRRLRQAFDELYEIITNQQKVKN